MILNHDQIKQRIQQGHITITPHNPKNIGPNSYDVHLHPTLTQYTLKPNQPIDPKKPTPTKQITIPPTGLTLQPGQFTLAQTHQHCQNNTNDLVPMIEGKSSNARNGLAIHITAGFGDIGYTGHWTLEIITHHPIILYPHMPIAQLYWITTQPTNHTYKGKYQNAKTTQPSLSHLNYQT